MRDTLAAIVGPEWVKDRRSELAVFDSDGLPGYRITPSLAVLPGNRAELIAVVTALAKTNTPFVPRGAGTGLSGGALADNIVLVCLNRLNRILHIDPVTRTARVEPGVVNSRLSQAAAAFGLHYAPDPSSQSVCTIGGNVAENAGGPHCLKYGVTLNHILECEVVLPNGSITRLGGAFAEPDGYDLLGVFVGSEGCFGIASEITVKLTPIPESVRTLLADFSTVDSAAHAVTAIIATGIIPAALEMMDNAAIRAVEASIYAAGYPTDAQAILLCEVDGLAEGLQEDLQVISDACKNAGAREIKIANNEKDRLKLWQGRKKAFGAMGRIAPSLVVQDAVVPRTKLPQVLARIEAIGQAHGVHVCNVFHAGDGNLHPNIPYNSSNTEESTRVHNAMSAIMQACIEAGGTITGEHGVGLDKLPYMSRLFDEDSIHAMHRVRKVFDPLQLANPGKVLPSQVTSRVAHEILPQILPQVLPQIAQQIATTQPATQQSVLPSEVASSAVLPPATLLSASPDSVSELAAIIREAQFSNSPLRFVGSGTWLSGGGPYATAQPVHLRNISGVVEYNPGDLVITVRAGTTISELNDITKRHGQMLALTPFGAPHSTIGATIATAAAAPLAFDDLSVRDIVLGINAVTGTGAITKAGGKVVKNVAGFDLVRLHTGAHGTLGAITEVSLRLHAIPSVDKLVHADVSQNLSEILPELTSISTSIPLLLILEPAKEPVLMARISGNSSRAKALQARLAIPGIEATVELTSEEISFLHERSGTNTGDIIARIRTAPSNAMQMLASVRKAFPNSTLFYSLPRGSLRIVIPTAANLGHEQALAGLTDFSVVIDQGRTTPPRLNHLEQGIKAAFDPGHICNRLLH